MRRLIHSFREHLGLVRSSIGVYSTQSLGFALGLVTNVLICRALGVSRQGELYVILTMAMVIRGFGGLGVETVLTAYSVREDVPPSQLNGLALFYCTGLAGVLSAAGIGVRLLLPAFLPVGYWAIILLAPLLLFQSCFSSLATGRHDIHFFNAFQVLGPVLNLLVVVFLHCTKRVSVESFALGFVASNSICILMMLLVLWARRGGFSFPLALGPVRQLFRIGIGGYLSGLLSTVRDRFNVFLIAAFGGSGAVGLYSVAWTLVEKMWLGADAVALVLTKRLAGAADSEARRIVRQIVAALAVPLAVAFGVGVYAGSELIPTVWGEQYRGAVPVFVIASFSFVFYFPSRLLAIVVSYTRLRPDVTAKLGAVSLAVTAPVAFWLNLRFGLMGAAFTPIVQATAILGTLVWSVYHATSSRRRPPETPGGISEPDLQHRE